MKQHTGFSLMQPAGTVFPLAAVGGANAKAAAHCRFQNWTAPSAASGS